MLLRHDELSNNLFNKKYILNSHDDINLFLEIEANQTDNNSNSSNYTNNTDNISCIYIHGEIVFVKYYILSFLGLFFGFLIILYGSYHYMFILIIDSIKDSKRIYDEQNNNLPNYLYLYAFSFFSGIILCIFIYEKEKTTIQYKIIKILYGCILGFFLFKSISYYYFCFKGKIIDKKIYYTFLFPFVIAGSIVNFFLNKLEFLPSSIILGTYFIISSISYILGKYYSDIIKITNSEEAIKDYTLFIIHIILIIA